MASQQRVLWLLSKFRTKGLCTDVAFIGGRDGICYPAHKPILACCSEYFRDVFKQRDGNDFEPFFITDVDPSALIQCIDYIYTGLIDICDDNLEHLLNAASFLKMHDIYEECIDFAISSISLWTLSRISKLAGQFPSERLQRATETFLVANFLGLALRMDFEKLDLSTVFTLLKSDRMEAIPERFVYQAVLTWVRYDLPVRRNLLPQLMKYVQFHKLPVHFLKQTVCKDEVIMENSECRNMLEDALFSYLASGTMVDGDSASTLEQERMVFFDRNSETVKMYDPWNGSWEDLPSLAGSGGKFTAVAVGRSIYVLGDNKRVHKLDTSDIVWRELANMHDERGDPRGVELDGQVYTSGGTSPATGRGMRTTERFDPVSNTWEKLSSMKKPRTKHCLAASGGYLYAIGGLNNSNAPVKHVERWHQTSGGWVNVSPMKQPRSGATCFVKDGWIYVIGGSFTTDVTVEITKPTLTTWAAVSFSIPRSFVVACSVSDGIYIINQSKEGKYEIQISDEKYRETVETVNGIKDLASVVVLRS